MNNQPRYFPLLTAFINTAKKTKFPTSSWFNSTTINIYIRHYSEDYIRMLNGAWTGGCGIVLANIQVEYDHRGKGIFKELIDTLMASDIDFKYLKIESVVNERFEEHLLKTGWKCIPNLLGGHNSYYLER